MKKILFMGLIIVAILLILIGVNFNKQEANEENVLIVGLDDSFPPMGFRNEKNEIVGFDIDIASAVAEKLDMKLKLQPISWAGKEQELDSGNIDCIWNGFAYNEKRAETMTLSNPYVGSKNIFVLKNGSTVQSQEELTGMKIGVQSGSIQQQDLEASEFYQKVEVVEYGDNLTAFMDLETGGVDAIFCSSIIGNYLIKSKDKDYETIDSQGISEENIDVVAFKKGNLELKEKVDKALYELKEDGTLAEISEKWFGENLIIVGEE